MSKQSFMPGWLRRSIGAVVGVTTVLSLAVVVNGADRPALDPGVPYEVAVVDVTTGPGGIVSATLVNRLDHSVRDVRLLIRHEWLWNNEMNPGPEVLNPGRSVYHTVEGTIPAKGRGEFVYRPDVPLRSSGDGTFRTTVDVVGFTEIGD